MIKTAVIGTGYLGKFHAEKIAKSPHAQLVAVCDIDLARAQDIAKRYNTKAYQNYRDLLGLVDAVHVVTPTQTHYVIAKAFLEKGTHTLIEKPITTTIDHAQQLIDIASINNAILQVGHLERFNNAVKAIAPRVKSPKFIESTRLAAFKTRGTDVNVILDIMIHDIDIIHSIVQSQITDIHATGTPVVSDSIDIANARISFTNGCIANITSSRFSLHNKRKIRIFCPNQYISADLNQKEVVVHKRSHESIQQQSIPGISIERFNFEQGDALKEQIESFFDCILNNNTPLVSGHEGKEALITALTITKIIKKQHQSFQMEQEA